MCQRASIAAFLEARLSPGAARPGWGGVLSYVLSPSHIVLALALILSWIVLLTSEPRPDGWRGWHRSRQAATTLIGSTGSLGYRATLAACGVSDEEVMS